MKSPSRQFTEFLAKYRPDIVSQTKRALSKIRALIPGSVELVYDNYNGLVIGWGPTDRPSEAIISLVMFPEWITLCFLQGKALPDPHHLLKGEGTRVRHVRLGGPADLDRAEIRTLVKEAVARSPKRFDCDAKRKMIIRSISKKQRPRRPLSRG